MNQFFDMRTLQFLGGLVSLLLVICMLYYNHNNKVYKGYYFWVAAIFSNFAGMILLSMRDILPDFLTIIIANPLLIMFYIFISSGIDAFSDVKQKRHTFEYFILVPFILLFLYFTYVRADVNARIIVFSLTVAIITLPNVISHSDSLKKVLNHKTGMISFLYLTAGSWYIFRTVYTLFFEEHIHSFLAAGIVHQLTMIFQALINITIMLAAIIITLERLKSELVEANTGLKKSLSEIKVLQGFIPICSNCRKIRNDEGYYEAIEEYIQNHTNAEFTHTLCAECTRKLYPGLKSVKL